MQTSRSRKNSGLQSPASRTLCTFVMKRAVAQEPREALATIRTEAPELRVERVGRKPLSA
jgi:hypothetical protein